MTGPIMTSAAPVVAVGTTGTAAGGPADASPGFATALDDALSGSRDTGRRRAGVGDDEPPADDAGRDDDAQPSTVPIQPGLWALLSAAQPAAPAVPTSVAVSSAAVSSVAGSSVAVSSAGVPAAPAPAVGSLGPAAAPGPVADPALLPADVALPPTVGTAAAPAAPPAPGRVPTAAPAAPTAPTGAVTAGAAPATGLATDVPFAVLSAAPPTPAAAPSAPPATAVASPAAATPAAPVSAPAPAPSPAAGTAATTDVLPALLPATATGTAPDTGGSTTDDGTGGTGAGSSSPATAPAADAGPVFPGPATTAPVTPSSPAADVPAGRRPAADPPVAAQLGRQLAVLTGAPDGSSTMTLVITPDELGPVSIQATVTDGTLDLTLRGAHEHGRHALADALPDLRRDLEAAGITLNRLEVGADTGTDGSPWARAAQQQLADSQGGQGRQGQPGSPRGWAAAGDHPGEGTSAPASDLSASRGVDVRV